MFNKALVTNILQQIKEASQRVITRFEPITSANDFTNSTFGVEKLDAICMQLITIGESLKNLDKISNKELLVKYPEVDWRGAKGLRDIISHHYFDIDAEQIYWVCDKNIPQLHDVIDKMLSDLK